MQKLKWTVGAAVVLVAVVLACGKQAHVPSDRAVQKDAVKTVKPLSLAELYAARDISREISGMTQVPSATEISSQKAVAETVQFPSMNRERLQAKTEQMQELYAKQNVSQEIARMGGSSEFVATQAK